MRTPNFFIIGAQKCGTTYLAKVLRRQPDVFFCEPKEPMFFSRGRIDREQFDEYLTANFSDARDEIWVGEGSTTYLQSPSAAENLKSFIPGTPKLIVCLRQPTEKAVSAFIHNWRRGRYAPGTRLPDTHPMPFGLSPIKTSMYGPSIAHWLSAYPREAFCFLNFDQLKEDPAAFVRQAAEFLGIPAPKKVLQKIVNAGFGLKWNGDVLMIDDATAPESNRPDFTRSELEELHALLQDDIAETERLTGLDLQKWRAFPTFV